MRSFYLYILTIFFIIDNANGQTHFTDVTTAAGIDHSFQVYEGMFGGGACVIDFNNDGWEDLYITGGMRDDILYMNNGHGGFVNVYEQSGMIETKKYVTQGVAGADVNRDGFVDLFITTISRRERKEAIPREINLLYINNGNGTFRNATKEFGLDQMYSFSTSVSFGDFNADGWPDAYIGNYFNEYKGKLNVIDDATVVGANQIAKGYLLLNENGKRFKDVYSDYDLDFKGFGFGGIFTDFDNDGDQDIFVNHDFGYKRTPDMLLENKYPWKSFKDVGKEKAMDLKINSMSTAVGDYNNDGLLDYYITNIGFNYFMIGQGNDKPYINRAKELGMSIFSISWGANFVDFDQDGDEDLFVSNGDLNPNCVPMGDFYYENQGKQFRENGIAMGVADYGIGRGSVVFDYDHDGDMDLLVVNQKSMLDYPVPSMTHLYRNDGKKGNWIKIKLKGVDAETHGIGSRIEIVAGGKRMIREIDGGASSHMSHNSVIAHFGLGNITTVDKIIIHWVGGNTQTINQVGVNKMITIVETPAAKYAPWYVYVLAGVVVVLLAIVLIERRKSQLSKE